MDKFLKKNMTNRRREQSVGRNLKGIQDFESSLSSKRAYAEAKGQKKVDMGEFIKQAELTGYDLDDEEE